MTDAKGAAGTVKAIFNVFARIAFTVTTAICTPTVAPLTCTNSQLQYLGGTLGGTPSVQVTGVKSATGQVPPGFTAYAKGGTVLGGATSKDQLLWNGHPGPRRSELVRRGHELPVRYGNLDD